MRLSKSIGDDELDDEEDESDSESDEKLDDIESDGGGYIKYRGGFIEQTGGGYDLSRYYSKRLNRYDTDLFSGYSMKQHKSQKQGTQKYTYAGKCSAWQGRQPIVVSKAELDTFHNRE